MLQAVILAGGLGTRLRPFSLTIPKPLLPLGDKPIIELLLGQLKTNGFGKIIVSLGYMAPLFQAFLGDGSRWGLEIDYVVEDVPLGTAGCLRLIPDLQDDFLVVNGDTLTDLRFKDLAKAHQSSNAIATIFSAKIDEYVDFGVLEFDNYGTLDKYIEKPTRHYHVSTGVYAISRRILKHAGSEARLDMPTLFRAAKEAGERVCCFEQKDVYWRDIGRFDHYESASKDFKANPGRFLQADCQ
ncbi:MAG: nucleotidyltransferase family protein [Pseudomonadota bacterium]